MHFQGNFYVSTLDMYILNTLSSTTYTPQLAEIPKKVKFNKSFDFIYYYFTKGATKPGACGA